MVEKGDEGLIFSFVDVTVKVQQKTLFKHLNLRLRKGDQLMLTGPGGSGKTTLLKALEGRSHISEGKITRHFYKGYRDENLIADPLFSYSNLIANVSERAHFKNTSNTSDLYYQQRYNSIDSEDALTVQAYLEDNFQQRLVSDRQWDVSNAITLLDLADLADKQIIKLSNGETKRLLIAAALVKNPILLLLDNPLTGLDVRTRANFNSILETIINSGITIVMTGSPNFIPAIISHVGIIEDGRVRMVPKKEFNPISCINKEHSASLKTINSNMLYNLLSNVSTQQYEHIIRLKNVSVKYGDKIILENINWEVRQGEHWILSGPNGSGKTTLLSLLNGDNPQAYANDVTLFDRKRGSGESIWDIKKKIGFVSPELHQYFPENISCLQAVESGFYDTQGFFRKSEPDKKAVALKWMEVFDLTGIADEPLKNAPASNQRILLLARALIKTPPLLILDEPCQGLDEIQQKYFRKIVEEVCKICNTTVLYVTHQREEIPSGFNLEYTLS